jgi:hypothetical protein
MAFVGQPTEKVSHETIITEGFCPPLKLQVSW